MAIANVVINNRRELANGAQDVTIEFDGDDAYPTGGTASFTAKLTAAIKAANDAADDKMVRGFENLEIVEVISGRCGGNIAQYDAANDKLKVVVISSGAEAAAAADLSAVKFNITCLCQ